MILLEAYGKKSLIFFEYLELQTYFLSLNVMAGDQAKRLIANVLKEENAKLAIELTRLKRELYLNKDKTSL